MQGPKQQRRPDRTELPERLQPRLEYQPRRLRAAPLQTSVSQPSSHDSPPFPCLPCPQKIPLSLVLTQENSNTVDCICWPESPVGRKVSDRFGGREEEGGERESSYLRAFYPFSWVSSPDISENISVSELGTSRTGVRIPIHRVLTSHYTRQMGTAVPS